MSINLIRVVNQQTIRRSILLDKLDDGQANTEGYAYKHLKQQVYVPFANPLNPVVKGYTDLVPTDRVLLSVDRGTIKGLVSAGRVTAFAFSSALIAAPAVTAVSHLGTDTTIDGTTFLSVTPDVTYVTFTTNLGVSQKIPYSAFSSFSATQIVVPDGVVTIGTPTEGWTVTVEANCKASAAHPIGNVATITTAVLGPTGDVTLTGANFLSTLPATSSVVFTGTGAVTLTQAAITGAGGTFTNVSIVVPAALVPAVAETATSAAVVAEGFTSAAKALIVAPVLTTATLNDPLTGDISLVGTSFLSTLPATSSVVIGGTGAVTLARADILSGGGTFTETSIVIPAAMVPGVVETATTATVQADGLSSATTPLAAKPVLTTAQIDVPLAGDLTVTGLNLTGTSADVIITGTGAITLSAATITGGGGTFTETSVVIPAALFTNGAIAATTSSAQVQADGLSSAVVVVTV